MTDPDLQLAREDMLRRQLQRRGISNRAVLAALGKVPRERFVPAPFREEAYADSALGIDCGQTISQPYIVALMTEALNIAPEHRVLEIGTGSGYQAAILAELAAEVVTIERHPRLSEQAAAVLASLGYLNVTFHVGDGTLGYPPRAPYDRIIVTAAASHCPPSLLSQLAEGGILVIPLGDQSTQVLEAIHKRPDGLHRQPLTGCRFVPLIGAEGWPT
jgi:protein-L-isoaspartate(D-aspartate) O-methyltransferase